MFALNASTGGLYKHNLGTGWSWTDLHSTGTDMVTDGGYPDNILANAPERIGDFFAVPKVVE